MRRLCTAATLASLLLATGPAPAASFLFVFDTNGTGTEYVLNGFDGVSLLSGTNRQGAFTAPYDGNTIFRDAKLARFAPVDPCRNAAANYNAAGAAVDQGELNAALTFFAANGCHARVVISSQTGTIRSFRPVAGF